MTSGLNGINDSNVDNLAVTHISSLTDADGEDWQPSLRIVLKTVLKAVVIME
jgi:hypothetical protein